MVTSLFRTQEILTVFFRHGFGDLLERMNLAKYLKSATTRDQATSDHELDRKTPSHFREALEELGGAFIKLGQLLSTRSDILPANWVQELTSLQDKVIAIDFSQVQRVVEDDLGPIEENFQFVDPQPLAVGSIAQVHRSITCQGDDAVIKVRKPGVKKLMLQDCDILEALAGLMEKHIPESRNYRPVEVVEEFRNAVTEELDFRREGENLDRFRSDFAAYPYVIFPTVHWDQTTERVLTMQRIEGIKVSLIEELRVQGTNTRRIAHHLAESVLRQVLEFGFFHGDPHPGNIMIVGEDQVCFLDCGMVGRLDEDTRENLVLLVAAGIRRDVEIITDILIGMNALPEDLDRIRFLKEANLFLDRYYRIPLKRLRIKSIIEDLNRLIRKFQIQVPSNFLLVGKALVTLDGVGRTLDPDFDAVEVAGPFIREMVMTSYGPSFIGRKLVQSSYDLLRLIRELPSDLRELTRAMRDNQLRIVLEHKGLRDAFREFNEASKHIALSIVIASAVLASSVIVHSGTEPRVLGIPILGLGGFAIASVFSAWLVISMVMKGKP
jgi:ubiquinone biosynthesis protein